jgi:TRAP-type uncharacterized transport system substrate-binding protein
MGGLAVGIYSKILAAILCLIAIVWVTLWYFIPAPPSTITIAVGFKGGAYEHIAERYRERLARANVTLDIRTTDGVIASLRLLKDRNSGFDAAFLFAGVTNSNESPELLSLGRIDYAPYWLFYRGAETLDRLTQLKGKRIAAGVAVRRAILQILSANGVNSENTTLLPLIGPATATALKAGEVDATFVPFDLNAPPVQSLLRDPDIRLMNLTHAEALTRLFPYLTRLVLPQGVVDLEKNIPASDVNLIAGTNVVVIRKDLHPELVYLLAQTLVEEHGAAGVFHRAGEFPTQSDPEFTVAEEARDFYKNGPSLLQRYLPFWMINVTKRIIALFVTAIAIVLPLFNLAPKLYLWLVQRYVAKLYRRLRLLEVESRTELAGPRLLAMQADLDSIDRAAKILPMRHSDLFFALRTHIDLTRTRLSSLLPPSPAQLRKSG